MKTLFVVLGVICCFVLLAILENRGRQTSCGNVAEKFNQIRLPRVISPTVEAAGGRLQIVGQVAISGNCGGLAPDRAVVFLLMDTETEKTYLVGMGWRGALTFPGSPACCGGE